MSAYKIEKDGVARFKNFETLDLAEAYALSLGVGFTVTLDNVEDFPPITRTRLDDQLFSITLYNAFVDANRAAGITPTESQELITALGGLKQLVDAGAVEEIRDLLLSLTGSLPIARVYTTARRDLDVLKIESYTDSL